MQSNRTEGGIHEGLWSMLAYLLERDWNIWEIPDEWRANYERVLDFSTRDIYVSANSISTRTDKAVIDVAVDVPFNAASIWDHKFLGPALKEMTHWTVNNFTERKPTFWCGENGIRGVLMSKVEHSA